MLDPDYEIFVAVVEAGSLSAAGRRLSISPAMMSKRLARLERRLGLRLLHRSTRRLAPTAEGLRLRAELVPIFAALARAEDAVRGRTSAPAGRLRVSAPTSFGRMHLAPHVARFLEQHPAIELSLDLSDEFTDLYAGRYDLALRIGATPGRGLAAQRLGTSRRVLCAAPRYLEGFGEPRSLTSLRGHRILAARGQLPWRLSAAGQRNVTFNGCSHVETNSSEVVRELAMAGAGVALRSLWDVGDELRSGRLRRILSRYEGSADVGIFAVYPRRTEPNAATAAFVAFLRELYLPRPPWDEAGCSTRSRPASV